MRFLMGGLWSAHAPPSRVYKVMKRKGRLSAIQIRYAGAKGMLCVNPALPNKKLLCLRLKMQKFPCFISEYLAVVKVSAPPGLGYKTRIALPVDRARNKLGVVDTTGKLRYRECTELRSPQMQQQGSPKLTVIEGTVLVTKCPCRHQGDLGKVTAVNVPELHHVVDCIMFSAQGPRPHPNVMAGSDLDGDEYVVIWEKRLFFPRPNGTPMNFCDRNPVPNKEEITIEDMIEMCKYIKNDSIGIISNAHPAWADQEREGIHSLKCLSIAEKIIVCLYFAKNCKIAYLRREERPHLYPDSMEKGSHKAMYRSDRSLGDLYPTGLSLEAAVGNLGHRHVDPGQCRALAVPGWEDYREPALQALAEYNAKLCRILNYYGTVSEGEIMACMVNTFGTYHNAHSGKVNMEDLVGKMTTFLMVTTGDTFYVDCLKKEHSSYTSDREELQKKKLRRASAWYMVTYESSSENSFFSFPWCIADILIEILRSTGTQDRVWWPNILRWKISQVVENSDLEEDDCLAAGCDTFKTAFRIIEEWLNKGTLLGTHQPGAASIPGLCFNCLLGIYTEFLGSRKLAPLGEIVTKKRHAKMVSPTRQAKDGTTLVPLAEALNNRCVGRQNSTKKAPSEAWKIVDGAVEPLYLDESEDENDDPVMAGQDGHGDDHEQDLAPLLPCSLVLWCSLCTSLQMSATPSQTLARTLALASLWFPSCVGAWSSTGYRGKRVGLACVQIQRQEIFDNTYIIVTALGRDWQVWFLEELLLQCWLPRAIDCGDLEKFLIRNPEAGQTKLGSRRKHS
ncbi:hypothetical protein HPB50_016133 [Hyalomma asiaticum]|uniref:Uncharacterized protein n=1 Tax=Hyalomma asiaticum TaxID=266040 RepID=A0ACB7TLD9_HYAAI|nr:hypothetical protein HPB50_016133 [Hyalomma asiaticum]